MTKFAGRNMKRAAGVLLCGVVLALPALAQSSGDQMQGPPPGGPPPAGQRGGGGRMNPEQRLEAMKTQLNLTPDQTDKVKAILEEGRAKMTALRNDTSVSQEDRRGKMMAMMQGENEKIKAVLNDEQKEKLAAMEKRMMENRRGGGPGGPPPPPPPPQS